MGNWYFVRGGVVGWRFYLRYPLMGKGADGFASLNEYWIMNNCSLFWFRYVANPTQNGRQSAAPTKKFQVFTIITHYKLSITHYFSPLWGIDTSHQLGLSKGGFIIHLCKKNQTTPPNKQPPCNNSSRRPCSLNTKNLHIRDCWQHPDVQIFFIAVR